MEPDPYEIVLFCVLIVVHVIAPQPIDPLTYKLYEPALVPLIPTKPLAVIPAVLNGPGIDTVS